MPINVDNSSGEAASRNSLILHPTDRTIPWLRRSKLEMAECLNDVSIAWNWLAIGPFKAQGGLSPFRAFGCYRWLRVLSSRLVKGRSHAQEFPASDLPEVLHANAICARENGRTQIPLRRLLCNSSPEIAWGHKASHGRIKASGLNCLRWLLATIVWIPKVSGVAPELSRHRRPTSATWFRGLSWRSVMSGNIFNSNGTHVGVVNGAVIFLMAKNFII
jgi:hypothetical protein